MHSLTIVLLALIVQPLLVNSRQIVHEVPGMPERLEIPQFPVYKPVKELSAPKPIQPKVVAKKEPVRAVVTGNKQDWMKAAGIPERDWRYVDHIIRHESGWCHTKWNGQIGKCPKVPRATKLPGRSSAFGLCQTMMSIHKPGGDFKTNPVTQLKWCHGYSKKYGGWKGAYQHWIEHRVW